MLFLGIDLTSSPRRPSHMAAIDDQLTLHSLDHFARDEELPRIVQGYRPALVAIDAPLGLPAGLDCLEEGCPCKPSGHYSGRLGEVELARMGIGCFRTTKRSIIKDMVYRGIRLAGTLRGLGFQVIEVYPYATKVALFGRGLPRKSTPVGRHLLSRKVSTLIKGLRRYRDGLSHDQHDALLASYTAYLHYRNETLVLGLPEEGQIVVPRMGISTPTG